MIRQFKKNKKIACLLTDPMASGGFSWIIIPVDKRNEYLTALEKASVNQDIDDFAKFVAGLVAESLKK